MSKNLIYANADEFHVKSTVVYTKIGGSVGTLDDLSDGETKAHKTLYYDVECTKPIYSDELERLFFAGGLKIINYIEALGEAVYTEIAPMEFLSPIVFSKDDKNRSIVRCFDGNGVMVTFSAPMRSEVVEDQSDRLV